MRARFLGSRWPAFVVIGKRAPKDISLIVILQEIAVFGLIVPIVLPIAKRHSELVRQVMALGSALKLLTNEHPECKYPVNCTRAKSVSQRGCFRDCGLDLALMMRVPASEEEAV